MANSLPDISRWLVTPSNPPRTLEGLDYERCAALHNYIVQHGWIGGGHSLDDLERRSWFERHGAAADNIRNRLELGLAKFLERAWDIDWFDSSFFYWVSGLNRPEDLWFNHGPDFAEPDEEWRFLTLYALNLNLASHGDGLVYDQQSHKAIVRMDISDLDIPGPEARPPWYPLESILSAWIAMAREGKVTAAPEDTHLANEKFDPWLMHPFSPSDLDKTIDTFNRLTTAIESRMPTPPPLPMPPASPLLDDATLAAANIPPGSFAHSFLTSARRPRCRFIAPGLLVPDAASFPPSQKFTSITNDDEDREPIPPVLLFRATDDASYALDPNEELGNPFIYDYREVGTVLAGLYTDSVDRRDSNIAEDGFRLLLPFDVGANGLAKKSDGSEVESAAQLYQHGYQPFGGDAVRAQRLVKLFENWLGMIERGDWEVGAEGVMGGITRFQGADSARWRLYWIEPSW